MEKDILEELVDLHKQATTEKSHYYVVSCCKKATIEILQLREEAMKNSIIISNLQGSVITLNRKIRGLQKLRRLQNDKRKL